MKPGDMVTLVHGLPPKGSEPATVVDVLGAKVRVQLAGGGVLLVSVDHLVSGAPSTRATHRAGDPETAIAAGRATGESLGRTQWLVLDALARAGDRGLIDAEHEQHNGLRPDSAGKRRKELQGWGLVEDTSTKRRTPRGQWAQVWRCTALGVEVWQQESKRRGAA